ncbi:hypothetical protein CPC08DRAFT_770529 [Agrocybe pediades]|nr:hypothetical protein CPC08DRAFT_770529 [Agrocybe pediades]
MPKWEPSWRVFPRLWNYLCQCSIGALSVPLDSLLQFFVIAVYQFRVYLSTTIASSDVPALAWPEAAGFGPA